MADRIHAERMMRRQASGGGGGDRATLEYFGRGKHEQKEKARQEIEKGGSGKERGLVRSRSATLESSNASTRYRLAVPTNVRCGSG